MTRERALELAREIQGESIMPAYLRQRIAETILAAVAEENEACAKIVDEYPLDCAAVGIAQQIRERGIPLKVGA